MKGFEQEESTLSKKSYQIVQTKVEQLEEKICNHKRRMRKAILIIIILFVLIVVILSYVYLTKTYTSYQTIESIEHTDSAGILFEEFNGNILKYSNDGAFYINNRNELIWNQTYEMQAPMLDICEEYAVIADEKGKKIYIMNMEGPCGEINTSRPIQQVHVANQGMVAVLMEEKGTGYIELYDKDGTFLAEGEIHAKNSGYPLDIAVSNDGRKMAVTMLDINEGIVKTTVAFYNFGSVGQNEIDNIVSSYPYSDTIMTKVEFLSNDVAVAVGDNKMVFYAGSQKPVVTAEVPIEREIQSLFYNERYVGLVFENEEQNFGMEIYDDNGKIVRQIDFDMKYEKIEFLKNNEICILNNSECCIYTSRGIKRFNYNFEKDIYKIIHTSGHGYIFVMSDTIERVKLK